MALPKLIRVKLLSDDAGAISITRVLARDMPHAELIGLIVAQVGKDQARIRRLLRGGNLVSGASRYRWEGCEVEETELGRLLAPYPDPSPGRRFEPGLASLVVLHLSGSGTLEVPRENLARRRLFRRRSFWDVLVEFARAEAVGYHDYSYREQADIYRWAPSPEERDAIRAATSLLTFSSLARRLRTTEVSHLDIFVPRPERPASESGPVSDKI